MAILLILLTLSVAAQFLTSAMAFRLNWVHGWKWPWTLISLGIAVMTVRRGITLYQVTFGESLTSEYFTYDGESLKVATAATSLIASILMLAGVALIGRVFSRLSESERAVLAQNQLLEADVHRAKIEFEAAREIQQSLYPVEMPQVVGYVLKGKSLPALACGGDYFEILPMRQNCWGIAVADVSGHGLGPALMMAQLHAYVRALVPTIDDPSELIGRLNSLLTPTEVTGRFVTIFFARLDPIAHRVDYVSAAHPGFLLQADGIVRRLDSVAPPLGVVATLEIPPAITLELREGDCLILPTDGLLEAVSEAGDVYGAGRLLSAIKADQRTTICPPIEARFHDLRRFTNLEYFHDDATLVQVCRHPTCHRQAV